MEYESMFGFDGPGAVAIDMMIINDFNKQKKNAYSGYVPGLLGPFDNEDDDDLEDDDED